MHFEKLRDKITEWACRFCASRTAAKSEGFRCDILLFVATTSEKNKLKEVAKSLGLNFTRKQGRAFRYYDLGNVGTYRVMAVRTEIGPFAEKGSAARAIVAKTETKASTLVCLGMAFGVNRAKQQVGDIVVSKILLPYDNRRIHTESGEMKTDYRPVIPYSAKNTLVTMLSNFATGNNLHYKVSFGAVLTGAARIHCSMFRDELVRNLSNHGELVVGGEMEGVGFLSASDRNDPCWIIVKGISDFADETRGDETEAAKARFEEDRSLASGNAARFILSALRSFDPDAILGNTISQKQLP